MFVLMASFSSRIYYRNTFLHVGHLQTLCYNNDFAKERGGTCYAIVDDRQNPMRSLQIQEDLDFLGTEFIKAVSVTEYSEPIHLYTKELAKAGLIYIPGAYGAVDLLNAPRGNFQLKLRHGCHPTIGYSKQTDTGAYVIIYIFDYIIKVLDDLLNVTDVVTTTSNDVADVDIMEFFTERHPLNYHNLETYKILGFRYSKKDWPSLPEDDPRLMTLRGLKARHVPAEVIYGFYKHATSLQKHDEGRQGVKITYFDTLMKNHMGITAKHVFGVVDPITVRVTNVENRYTEFVFKPFHPMKPGNFNIVPLSNTLYVDRGDFSLVEHGDKLSKDREVRLKYGNVLYCTGVTLDDTGSVSGLSGKYYHKETISSKQPIHWVSAEAGKKPRKARFFLYNWFFTGDNLSNIQDPIVKDGYIDECVFEDLTQMYQLERVGYFVYDEELTRKNGGLPCFIKICNIAR